MDERKFLSIFHTTLITILYKSNISPPGHYSDNERPQLPHSTKQDSGGGNSSEGSSHGQKRVSSQLQSLLQMHLVQRSQAAAITRGNVSAASSTTVNGGSTSVQALSPTQVSVSSTLTKVRIAPGRQVKSEKFSHCPILSTAFIPISFKLRESASTIRVLL